MKTKATKKSKVQAVADRFNAAGPARLRWHPSQVITAKPLASDSDATPEITDER